jgi:hypothetical protein
VILNLNNVLNKDNSDLRVTCSASTREFVGFYGPFIWFYSINPRQYSNPEGEAQDRIEEDKAQGDVMAGVREVLCCDILNSQTAILTSKIIK